MARQGDADPTPDEYLAGWKRDLEALKYMATTIVTDFHFYGDLLRLAMSGPIAEVESYFWAWLVRAYSTSSLIRIRSLYESPPKKRKSARAKHTRMRGLGLLLSEIRENCHVITWEWYKQSRGEDSDLAGDWSSLCGEGTSHLPRDAVEADLAELREKVKPITDHVDQYIAHFDRNPIAARDVKKIEVEDALMCFRKILNRYLNLLFGYAWEFKGTVAGDWAAIFRQPWVSPRRPALP